MPILKFFIRNTSIEEQEAHTKFSPPSREDWEMLKGYEPTKAPATYEIALENYNRAYTNRINLPASLLTMDKIAIHGDDDPIVQEIEKRSDFVRWV